jgi:dCMP deaminase
MGIHNKGEKRPAWDDYFAELVEIVAKRSTCLRRKVGAVIVKDNRIVASGYNGVPKGLEHCSSFGCMREKEQVPSGERHELCRGVHAEMNAIAQAAEYGIAIKGSVVYCTHQPCVLCSKLIINCGIVKVYVKNGYPDVLAQEMLQEAGIDVVRI